jgi:flagellar biosynthetic protein FlhB
VSGEKTEKPTPRRKREARREGRIARTPDLGAWLGVLGASVLLPMTLRLASARVVALTGKLPDVIRNPNPDTALRLLREVPGDVAVALAPLCGGLLLIGVIASAAQGGLRPSPKVLVPKFNRLNPLSGVKRLLGPHAWWELIKALVKAGTLGLVLWLSVRRLVPLMMASGALPLSAIVATLAGTVLTLIRSAAIAGLVMAVADYLVAYRRTAKQIRMTKREVKDEMRRSEGDPLLKSAIRSRQLAMARNRMMTDLPKADVVVVNPTHVAVALRYEPHKGAPRVIAKGAGEIAAKIREVATRHRIPIIQEPPLARALYQACDLGQEIPPELYTAVARVLAFVMGLRARGSAAGFHRPFPESHAA